MSHIERYARKLLKALDANSSHQSPEEGAMAQSVIGYLEKLQKDKEQFAGDGSNTLDTIVSILTNGLVVNCGQSFYKNQYVDIWTAVNGAYVATLQIKKIEANTLLMTTSIPSFVLVGMLVLLRQKSDKAIQDYLSATYEQAWQTLDGYLKEKSIVEVEISGAVPTGSAINPGDYFKA